MTSDFSLDQARLFVARLDVPERPTFAADMPEVVFDKAKEQALVVGSQVVSFDSGVEPEFREAISDGALLAQLAANRKVAVSEDPIAWFKAYFEVLSNIGWVIQAFDTAKYDIKTDGVEVHEAVLQVVQAFIGNVPGAVALVQLTLKSLQAMDSSSPLITLFHRESQHAEIGRFQFTTIRQDESGGLLGEAMAFSLRADKSIKQILFFKLHRDKSTLERSLGTISLNRAALEALRPVIRGKVQTFMGSFVASLDLGSPGI